MWSSDICRFLNNISNPVYTSWIYIGTLFLGPQKLNLEMMYTEVCLHKCSQCLVNATSKEVHLHSKCNRKFSQGWSFSCLQQFCLKKPSTLNKSKEEEHNSKKNWWLQLNMIKCLQRKKHFILNLPGSSIPKADILEYKVFYNLSSVNLLPVEQCSLGNCI